MSRQTRTKVLALVTAAVVLASGVALTSVAAAGEAGNQYQTTAGNDAEPIVGNDTQPETLNDTQAQAYVRIVHASSDAPLVDVSIDDVVVMSNVSVGNVSVYRQITPGAHNVSVSRADDGTNVFNGTVIVDRASVTSVVVTDGANETDAAGLMEKPDDAIAPDANESAVSVAHLSPDAPAVDVTAANGSVVIADNLTFRNASEYVTVPPGNYTLEVRNATATNDGAVLETFNVSLSGGTAYSAFAVGYLTPGDEPRDVPFKLAVVQDATVTIELVEGANVTVVEPAGAMDETTNETAEPGEPAEDDGIDFGEADDNETGVENGEEPFAEEGDNDTGLAEEAP